MKRKQKVEPATKFAPPDANTVTVNFRLSEKELNNLSAVVSKEASAMLDRIYSNTNALDPVLERSRALDRNAGELVNKAQAILDTFQEYTARVAGFNQQYYDAIAATLVKLEAMVGVNTGKTPLVNPKEGYVLVPVSLSLLKSVGMSELINSPSKLQERVETMITAVGLMGGKIVREEPA